MKKRLPVIGITTALAAMMLACFNPSSKDTEDYSYEDYSYEDFSYEDFSYEDYSYEDFSYEDESYDDGFGYDGTEEDVFVLGNDDLGFIDLPSNFHNFYEAGGISGVADSAQAQSDEMNCIITMCIYDVDLSVEDMAVNLMGNLEQEGTIQDLTGARVTIGGYDAYQVYGYYSSSDTFLVIWLFETDEDDYVHYIASEFNSTDSNGYKYPETFHY